MAGAATACTTGSGAVSTGSAMASSSGGVGIGIGVNDNAHRARIEPEAESAEPVRDRDRDPLGPVERYIALWILICIGLGLVLAHFAPRISEAIDDAAVGGVSIPIGVCLFVMMYPALINLQLAELKKVLRYPKPLLVTFVSNWIVAPAISAALAYAMLRDEPELQVAVILLGASPCTAMVLVWNLLAQGNQEQNVINTSFNTVTILALYAPIVELLTGVQGIGIDRVTLFTSVAVFIGIPMVVGLASKTALIRWKGADWFTRVYKPFVDRLAVIALFITLIVLFALNGQVLFDHPLELVLVSAPLLVGFAIIVALNLAVTRWLGFAYREAVTTVIIGSSSHFEIAIATAVAMYGTASKAALGTTMGLFWEVPVMLSLVELARYLRKRGFWSEPAGTIAPAPAPSAASAAHVHAPANATAAAQTGSGSGSGSGKCDACARAVDAESNWHVHVCRVPDRETRDGVAGAAPIVPADSGSACAVPCAVPRTDGDGNGGNVNGHAGVTTVQLSTLCT